VATVNLAVMRAGESGKILNIAGGFGLRRRLEALGVRLGVRITKISGAAFRGPVVVRVGNTTVALGHHMARKVRVEVQ